MYYLERMRGIVRRGRQVILGIVLGIGFCFMFAGSVQAVIIPVYGITNNNPADVAIGEDQLFIDVTNGGPDVTFTFYNVGATMCTITDVYFDDGTLLEITGLIDSDEGTGGDPLVDFTQHATPGDLPGGGSMPDPFETSIGFSADSDPAVPKWGVSPGEFLAVEFSLTGGDINHVLQELLDTTLRIGFHVQNFNGSGGSESFVNQPVPEPATMALLGLGVLMLRRRR